MARGRIRRLAIQKIAKDRKVSLAVAAHIYACMSIARKQKMTEQAAKHGGQSNDWSRERAKAVTRTLDPFLERGSESAAIDVITAALDDAMAHGLEALRRAHEQQQEAVKAERERLLSRLREPDEAMVEAFENAYYSELGRSDDTTESAVKGICAIADTLDTGES